ncbi:phospholipase A2 inhibitor beta isoform X3 [Hemibagrus wyckioides]|uniref:phospholipase A2 inhibitor beta isoform X3 n=1 Tax=Hemibagrus wyckioides TaxID=337641 RepID=UPI00266CC452|nr:phospholipase A2 inhibitor beta isoform X3 [Hemibagrus wyckioides]
MMAAQGLVCLAGLVSVLCVVSGSEGGDRCECPAATIMHHFPSRISNQTCCLNFTGSSFPHFSWATLRFRPNLQILDLSSCNVTHLHDTAAGSTPASLREIYLNQNQLRVLPPDFLVDAISLEALDLGQNLLEELPVHFLKNAENLQVLILSGNRLESIPASVLKLPLQQMDLWGNLWTCSCSFMEVLHSADQGNSSRLQDMVANLTCSSPEKLSGRTLWSVHVDEVCRLSGLNALFILLPLLLLVLLTLCWCCGRKEEKKDSTKFGTVHMKNEDLSKESTKDNMLKNQLMFRPSSALLGSTRDIYEEVEVKLGSVDSLETPPSTSSGREENQELDSKQDLETVSVSKVMRDSADREKAYMIQSTKYYSLVPGLEMDDSDHGEYETVDLS